MLFDVNVFWEMRGCLGKGGGAGCWPVPRATPAIQAAELQRMLIG